MSLEDETNNIDRDKMDEILMYLMMSCIVETRAMLNFIFDKEANGDPELIKKYKQELKELGDKEYQIIKDQLYRKFGSLPQGLFD